MDRYYLDTNVASFIMDGELWQRSPSTLMTARQELVATWRLAGEQMENVPAKNDELLRSVCAYTWVQKRIKASAPSLLLPPTVQQELSYSPQV